MYLLTHAASFVRRSNNLASLGGLGDSAMFQHDEVRENVQAICCLMPWRAYLAAQGLISVGISVRRNPAHKQLSVGQQNYIDI